MDLAAFRPRPAELLYILGAQLQKVAERGHVDLLFGGIALRQGHAQVLGILEQFCPHQGNAEQEHAHTRRDQQDAQGRIGRQSFATFHVLLSFFMLRAGTSPIP